MAPLPINAAVPNGKPKARPTTAVRNTDSRTPRSVFDDPNNAWWSGATVPLSTGRENRVPNSFFPRTGTPFASVSRNKSLVILQSRAVTTENLTSSRCRASRFASKRGASSPFIVIPYRATWHANHSPKICRVGVDTGSNTICELVPEDRKSSSDVGNSLHRRFKTTSVLDCHCLDLLGVGSVAVGCALLRRISPGICVRRLYICRLPLDTR